MEDQVPVNLRSVDRSRLHATFQAAFADYGMDMSYMTEENIRIRAVKNAVDWDLSVGAFDGERMVGFTLIGVDTWGGRPSAFDAATGIIPGFRGRGLAHEMFDHALPALRERGVQRFALEVLQGNDRAVRAYRKAGFEVSREFGCFDMIPDPSAPDSPMRGAFEIREADRSILDTLEGEADWLPSWENSFAAVRRIPEDLVVLGAFEDGEPAGAVVFTPALRWIMSLLVTRTRRRLGLGTALVRRLAGKVAPALHGGAMKLINVDRSDPGMIDFAGRCGFAHRVDQFEMIREI